MTQVPQNKLQQIHPQIPGPATAIDDPLHARETLLEESHLKHTSEALPLPKVLQILRELRIAGELSASEAARLSSFDRLFDQFGKLLDRALAHESTAIELATKLLGMQTFNETPRLVLEDALRSKDLQRLSKTLKELFTQTLVMEESLVPALRAALLSPQFASGSMTGLIRSTLEKLWDLAKTLKELVGKRLNKTKRPSQTISAGSSTAKYLAASGKDTESIPLGGHEDRTQLWLDIDDNNKPPQENYQEEIARCLEAFGQAQQAKKEKEEKAEAAQAFAHEREDKKIIDDLRREYPELLTTPYAMGLVQQILSDPPGPLIRDYLRRLAEAIRLKKNAA